MKLILLGILILISRSFSADYLEDVAIMDVTTNNQNILLKLKTHKAPNNSYFFVDITQSDKDLFNKFVHIINKQKYGSRYQFNLNIPSFSTNPSGAYFRSDDIIFSGSHYNVNYKTQNTIKKSNS